jgi:hypothetical protein
MNKIIGLALLLLFTVGTLQAQSAKQKAKPRKQVAGFQEISGIGMEVTVVEKKAINSPRDAASGTRKVKRKCKARKSS